MFQILLVTALCLDAFTASLAYAANQTKMPAVTVVVISLVCTSALAVSAGLSTAAQQIISANVSSIISFSALLLIGLVKSCESFLKRLISRKNGENNQLHMKLFDLNFVLTVYADNDLADIDHSKTLSVREAVYLALALSFDGFAAGFGWGLTHINYFELIFLSLLSNLFALALGYVLGKLITKKTKADISWVGGVILVLLAFTKLTF